MKVAREGKSSMLSFRARLEVLPDQTQMGGIDYLPITAFRRHSKVGRDRFARSLRVGPDQLRHGDAVAQSHVSLKSSYGVLPDAPGGSRVVKETDAEYDRPILH